MGQHKLNPFAKGSAVPLASSTVRDAYGRTLAPGDLVALTKPLGLQPLRVTEVTPVLDPTLPAGTVRVGLLMHLLITVRAELPVQEFVRIVTAAEQGLTVKSEEEIKTAGGLVDNTPDAPPAPEVSRVID